MNARTFLMCFALSIGCSSVYAQSQGLVQSFLNGAGVGGLGAASSSRQQNADRAKAQMEGAIRRGRSPAEACSKASSNIPFAPYGTDQCLSDATELEKSIEPVRDEASRAQSSSIFAPPTLDAQRANARGYMLNDSVSAQTACRRAVLPTRGNPYTEEQCLQDMTAAAPEIDETRKSRQVAAQEAIAAFYPRVVEQAVQTSLKSGSTDSACSAALRSISGIPDERRDEFENQCNKDMRPVYVERVRAASYKPLNCDQWAIKKGDAWRSAPVSMQFKPVAKSTGPAQFSGEIKNAEGIRLTVITARFPAYVDVDPSTTMVFDSDKIQVGSVASGYGVISGKEEVQLTTGALMTIPVFKAACIN